MLVILDSCRADVARTVTEDYEFLENFEVIYSRGSVSRQWMRNTFTSEYREEMQQTTYVTANVFSEMIFNGDEFEHLEEVWRYATDEDLKVVLPHSLTDRAIDIGREHDFQRMIVYYMQPHMPLLNYPEFSLNYPDLGYIGACKEGEISQEEALNYHRDNLEAVLDDVKLLYNSIDAETVVITADHGEGLGERNIYGHSYHRIHPCLRHVPWWETTAQDTGIYTPEIEVDIRDDVDVNERLEDLGYKL